MNTPTGFAQRYLTGLLLCALTLLCVPTAHATTVLKLTDEQIVEHSSIFVRATVVDQKAIWAPKKIGIVTLVKLKIEEEIFNRSTPTYVYVRHFGGTIGKVTMHMPSGPKFTNGEEVLVALQSSPYLPKNEYLLVGLTQGKWTISPADPQAQKQGFTSTRTILRASEAGHLKLVGGNTNLKVAKASPKILSVLLGQLRTHWKTIQLKRQKQTLPLQFNKPTPRVVPLKKPIILKKPLRVAPIKPIQPKKTTETQQ